MKNYIYIFVIFITGFGCNMSMEKLSFPKQIPLKGNALNITDQLGLVYLFKYQNEKLILIDENGDFKLNVIDLKNKKFERFGKTGRGPDELVAPGSILPVDSNRFLVYDNGKKEILQVSLDDKQHFNKLMDLPATNVSTFQVERINDSLYFGTGIYKNGRFMLFTANRVLETGNYPTTLDTNVPFYVHAIGYLSLVTKNPESTLIAVATRYGGLLQIFRVDEFAMDITEIAKYESFLPQYTTTVVQGSPNFDIDNNTRWGYIYVVSDSRHIYGLYSGKVQREDSSFQTGNTVHVFKWDGTPEYEIKTDQELFTIAVDSDHNCLYGLFNGPDGYDVIQYRLDQE